MVPPGAANVTHTRTINKMWGRLASPVSLPFTTDQAESSLQAVSFQSPIDCILGIPELSPPTIHLDRPLGVWGPTQLAQRLLSQGPALRKQGTRNCELGGVAAYTPRPAPGL